MVSQAKPYFEKEMQTLGELPHAATSVDIWFEGATYCVAVECKLGEREFGSCSRTRLKPTHEQYCDETYTRQGGRTERCALTEIKVRYWRYVGEVFGWSSEIDHRPCPLRETYQLARNVLAACVDDHGNLRTDRGHALVIYDQRNPAMAEDGSCDRSWHRAYEALRARNVLRRLSWQGLIAQWPSDPILNWLKEKLGEKYGLLPS